MPRTVTVDVVGRAGRNLPAGRLDDLCAEIESHWTLRDKLIGTLIVPGGIAAVLPALLIAGSASTHLCTRGPGIATHCVTRGGPSGLHQVLGIILLAVIIAGPIVTAIYLAVRAGSAARGAA